MDESDRLLIEQACDVVDRQHAMLEGDREFADKVHAADSFGMHEKGCFPIFEDGDNARKLVYLDSAATSQRLGCALDAEYRFNACGNANIYRGAYKLSAEATQAFNEARCAIGHFINADDDQVIFTTNATQGLNLIAQA